MDAKDEIKDRLSIEEVVGDYLELKKAGRNFKGLSPWTGEKSASLMVSPDKQIWHDFSSSKGGDIFSFVMEMEGIDFRAALELLARKAGVELEQFSGKSGEAGKVKKRLIEANTLAAKYYQATLLKNKTALSYVVEKRGFGKDIIKEFSIGYAPNKGFALVDFLGKKGFSKKELTSAGLAVERRGRVFDMFRGRVLVALSDGTGQVVGFTGRAIHEDDTGPKYLNTPQTMVYDKGRQLFGLHLAKDAIREQGFAIVVEGNLDVLASHKAGLKNVVASAGTALTKHHMVQLSRLTEDIRLSFDADKAGLAATERVIPIAQEINSKISIITLPEGKDPDDLIQENVKSWERVVKQSKYVVDWVMETYSKQLDLNTAGGKKELSDRSLAVVAKLSDPVEQEHYLREVAKRVGVRFGTIQVKFGQIVNKKERKKRSKTETMSESDIVTSNAKAHEDQLLGLNLMYADTRESLKDIEPIDFDGDVRAMVCEFIMNSGPESYQDVPSDLSEAEEYVKIIILKTEELYGNWSATDRMIEAIGLAQRLIRESSQKRQKRISKQIKAAEEAGDDKEVSRLLQEFDRLLRKD